MTFNIYFISITFAFLLKQTFKSYKMNDKWNHEILLVVTILGAFVCLLIANGVLERIIERPFLNHVNFRNERFNSPPNIIFLTSAIILAFSSIAKCLKKPNQSSDL